MSCGELGLAGTDAVEWCEACRPAAKGDWEVANEDRFAAADAEAGMVPLGHRLRWYPPCELARRARGLDEGNAVELEVVLLVEDARYDPAEATVSSLSRTRTSERLRRDEGMLVSITGELERSRLTGSREDSVSRGDRSDHSSFGEGREMWRVRKSAVGGESGVASSSRESAKRAASTASWENSRGAGRLRVDELPPLECGLRSSVTRSGRACSSPPDRE